MLKESTQSFSIEDDRIWNFSMCKDPLLSKSLWVDTPSTRKSGDLENFELRFNKILSVTPLGVNLQPTKGFIFMFFSVLGMTLYHIFAKLATFRNPNLNNNDLLLFVGMMNFCIYLGVAMKEKVNLCPMTFKSKIIPFILSLLWALGINNFMMIGLSHVPVCKAVLVFDINPILWIILAGVILKEKIESVYVFSALGSLLGIYFLTMNSEDSNKNSNVVLGIIWVLLAAFFQGCVFVTVRILGAAKIHYTLRPLYAGLVLLIFSILMQGGINSYTLEDICLMTLWGLSWAMWLGFQTAAFSCQLASKLAPMIFIENIFTLFADAVIFGYQFRRTDVLGICIVSLFILLPFLKNRVFS